MKKPSRPSWVQKAFETKDRMVIDKREHSWERKNQLRVYSEDALLDSVGRALYADERKILYSIEAGDTIKVGASIDRAFQKMQSIINEMVQNDGMSGRPPTLVLHTLRANFKEAASDKPQLWVTTPAFIEMNKAQADHFLKKDKGFLQFRAVIAHEMAHIINRDLTPKKTIEDNTSPPTRKAEILADRMGAIIHGNPMKYAEATSAYFTSIGNGKDLDIGSAVRPSYNHSIRSAYKWAKFLESQGAVDKNGDVILDKALAVYNSTKDFTDSIARIEQMQYR